MKIERTRNAVRNVAFGVVEKINSFIFPFVSRTIFIYYLGIEYLGLNSLFTSVLSVLSLAELGIGNAMVFHMYKAIADDDAEVMCALLNFYKKCYRIIGIVMLAVGTAIMPILHLLVKGGIPSDINLYIIYYINLLSTVSTYFLYAYKSSLLIAFQRNDILSKINSLLTIIQCIMQIGVIVIFHNYYCYAVITIIINIIRNLLIQQKSDKLYPQYETKGKLEESLLYDIKEKVSALFIYKVGNVVSNSVDTIVISAFLGLSILGIYNNYFYVITMLTSFLQIYYSAISSGIGNSISVETTEKNYKDYTKLMFLQSWVVGWSSICLLCLYQPFMTIWMGQSRMLPFDMVICLTLFFYFWKIQDIAYIYKEAAGLWQHDKYASIAGTVFNLIVNIILVQKIGIYGITLSTILMNILITIPWGTRALYKFYFNKSVFCFYKLVAKYSIITLVAGIVTYGICLLVKEETIVLIVIRIVICFIVPNIIFLVIYRKDELYAETKNFLLQKVRMIRRK